ncbi:MAG TPA: metallophosphoesterase [Nocardioidaceae bacterium]|nr:metallophosphoesterase [Nocardioidaceae bacterium]
MRLRELREHAEELGFAPQGQVRWLAPGELARTAVKVLLATVFAGYSDKREIQAALDCDLLRAPLLEPDAQEAWIDYVADLGDGFDATSSVAWSLAAEKLTVEDPGGGESIQHRLPRGSLLVLGGDEVYPAASAVAYENRTKGPYRAALPTADDRPLLVALPGNHDWYDGLTSFLRLFTHGRPIGGWQTAQTRSYFAVQLPQRWWLVGLDSQLGTYIDDPQLDYFREHLSRNLQPGDGVIICAAEPTWVETAAGDVDAFNVLHWFDRTIVRTRTNSETGLEEPTGASIRLWLTGDQHHYARYAERLRDDPDDAGATLAPDPRRRQLVTCGLGGAYLASTHRLPPELPLPPKGARMKAKDEPLTFARAQVTYPDVKTSRRLARRIATPWSRQWLPVRNPGFAEVAAGLHAVLWLATSFAFALTEGARRPVGAVRGADAGDLLGFAGVVVGGTAVLLALGWADRLVRAGEHRRPSSATAAVVLQGAAALLVLAVTVAIPWPAEWSGWLVLALCLTVAGVLGAALGSEAFALYILSARAGSAADWQMSGQAVEDHKGFLRLHIGPDADLTVYPLVLDKVCHDWDLVDDPAGGKRPVPAAPLRQRLVEPPFVVAREASTP